jgi:GT2 family glycosyltransferase
MVSICVPNLNTRAFLEERFESIFKQTFGDWELVVVDNFSEDGAWDFFRTQADRDSRMRISQAPREGMYANWNNCIREARGEYVYIATSDDTMTPDCLEKLVAALDQHPDCGIAHCCLTFIDEKSQPILTGHCWGNHSTTLFMGEWNKKQHVRPRGHDTVMALGLKTPYYSITQILVRRTLFDEVGLFENHWGSFGDLEWQMRASLATKTVHIPEYLATWRIHPQQASQLDRYQNAVREGLYLDMAETVIRFSQAHNLPFQGGLPKRLRRFYWNECIKARLRAEPKYHRKFGVLLKSLSFGPALIAQAAQRLCRRQISGKDGDIPNDVRKELSRLGLDNVLPEK